MGLIRRFGDLIDAFVRGGDVDDAPVENVAAAAGSEDATPASVEQAEIAPAAAGGVKRRVAVLADLVAIAKDMGRVWPKVRSTVEHMEWLPRPGAPSGRRMSDVADALLDSVVAAADASIPRGEEARRLRPVLRDVRQALGLYAAHRIELARYVDPEATTAILAKERFLARIAQAGLDHLGIDWSDAAAIGTGIVDALGRTLPAEDARARYVPKTDRGRRYLDLPVAEQIAREASIGEPRVFQAQVDVVGLLATAVCASYEPAMRRAAAEKMRHWIVENLPSLPSDLRRAHADWMIDIQPRRMRSWEPVLIAEVALPQMPFAAFEDALAKRRFPTDAEQAATIVKGILVSFVREQHELHRAALEPVRDEYVAETRIEISVERQLALASATPAPAEMPAYAP